MHIPFFIFMFLLSLFFLLNKKYYIKKDKNMSAEIIYLMNLHKEWKLSDSALDKALNALQPAQNVEQVEQSADLTEQEVLALENLRKKTWRKERAPKTKMCKVTCRGNCKSA